MNTITDDQIAEIEALAEKSCQYSQEAWFTVDNLREVVEDPDAEYFALASPFSILALISRLREAERDAARYRWLRERLVGASFDWDGGGMSVLAFEMPDGVSIGADCDKNIDTAMKGEQQ